MVWEAAWARCRTPQNSHENVPERVVQTLPELRHVQCCDNFPEDPVPQEKSNSLLTFSQNKLVSIEL